MPEVGRNPTPGGHRRTLAWALGILAFLLVLAPLGLEVKHAAAKDPRFCINCHQMDTSYTNWAISPHAEITCVTCHPGGLASDLRHAWLGLVMRVDTIEHPAVVDEGACIGCHVEGGEPHWPAVAATAGHQVHHTEHDIRCVDCHGGRLHVERPATDICARCHETELTVAGMVGRVHCLDCHAFLAEQPDLTPTAATCTGCHQADAHPEARSVEAHGTLDCLTCHAPHDPTAREAARCADCHDQVAVDHGVEGQGCADCHAPHEPAHGAAQACADCHDRPAHKGHLACGDCHDSHEPTAPAARCAECHELRRGLHAKPSHRQCLTCHRPHRATRPDAQECLACHESVTSWHARTGCVGCHTFRRDLPDREAPAR